MSGEEKMKMILNGIQTRFLQMKNEASFKSILITVGFLLLAAMMVNSTISNIQLRYEKSDLQNQVVELQNQDKSDEQKLEQASTKSYIEEQARQQLGMVKSNEVPIKIVEKQTDFETVDKLKPSEKFGVYMKDWYSSIEKWITHL